jgi:hypothetical protein
VVLLPPPPSSSCSCTSVLERERERETLLLHGRPFRMLWLRLEPCEEYSWKKNIKSPMVAIAFVCEITTFLDTFVVHIVTK